jgi:manganese-dependent inorganic pyrophosphatase
MTFADHPILVLGHRNPDTDAIASAIGYAWLLNTRANGRYEAGRLGDLNAQTQFAADRFGVQAPPFVADVRARLRDIAEAAEPLHAGHTLRDACAAVYAQGQPVPLLGDDGKPRGLITAEGLFAALAPALSTAAPDALAAALAQPASAALQAGQTPLQADLFASDALGDVVRTGMDEYLVVDADGGYVGVAHKADIQNPPSRRVVLVDHNELTQAVSGMEEAELVELLDHHRLSGPTTQVPVRIRIEPIGSTSTLVAERAAELGETLPAPIAGLLLSGILSDTLVFRSPTCTPRDEAAAHGLAVAAGLAAAGSSPAAVLDAITTYGAELLAAGAGLAGRTAEEILNSDIKFFEAGEHRVGIAQVEVAGYSDLIARRDELLAAMAAVEKAERVAAVILMVTNVTTADSRLLAVGSPRILGALPFTALDDGTLDAPGVVSRKKQLLPPVLDAMEQLG